MKRYQVYCRQGFDTEWVWDFDTLPEAEARVGELLDNGYDDAWVKPASEAQALENLEIEVASLRARLKNRNRQIRDLRRSLRKQN